MNVKSRLLQLCQELRIPLRELEINIGVSSGCLSHINDSLTRNIASKIEAAYPNVNLNWLRTGKGDMFATPEKMKISDEKAEEILAEVAKQREVIERFQKQIDLCQEHINILLSTLQDK